MKSMHGHLLVSSPQLLDPNFAKSVVLMVQHNDEGALGLILNHPLDTTIAEAWEKVMSSPCPSNDPLHHGGPCESPLMVLHGHKEYSQVEVSSGVHFSTEEETVRWLLDQEDVPFKFFVGCAGWAPGQLEEELATGSWLTSEASAEDVFHGDDDQWFKVTKRIAADLGFPNLNPRLIPPDPSYN